MITNRNFHVCPRCDSENLNWQPKGFGYVKAIICALIFGPLGFLIGLIDSKKMQCKCEVCKMIIESNNK